METFEWGLWHTEDTCTVIKGKVDIPTISVEGGGKKIRTLFLTLLIWWETPDRITCSFSSFLQSKWVARFSTTAHSTLTRPLLCHTLSNQVRHCQLQVSPNALVAKVSCSFTVPHFTPHSYQPISGANQSVALAKVNDTSSNSVRWMTRK